MGKLKHFQYLKYYFFYIILALLWNTGCKTSKKTPKSSFSQEEIIKIAKKQIGTPYLLGGTSKKGFDCSGFVYFVFKSVKINLPRNTTGLMKVGVKVELRNAQKGDLIFFKGASKKSRKTGHVGIVIEGKNDNLEFIHASTSKGIMISKLGEKYFKERFVGIRRVVD